MTESKNKYEEKITDLLEKSLIIKLWELGIPQSEIRKIVKVDLNKVNAILKAFKDRK